MGKYYKVLCGNIFDEAKEIYWGFLYWSPIYRDTDYLITALGPDILEKGEDKLNCGFTLSEAKDHVERLKLKQKYNIVAIIETVENRTNTDHKSQSIFDKKVVWDE